MYKLSFSEPEYNRVLKIFTSTGSYDKAESLFAQLNPIINTKYDFKVEISFSEDTLKLESAYINLLRRAILITELSVNESPVPIRTELVTQVGDNTLDNTMQLGNYFVCPCCGDPIQITYFRDADCKIPDVGLTCSNCKNSYNIIR